MPVRYFMLALLLWFAAPAFVQSQDAQTDPATRVYDDDASLPSMELLEFLGEWESEDGEWIDPLLLDEMPIPERESSDE